MTQSIMVFDCDGHIIESIPEMVPFLNAVDRYMALAPMALPMRRTIPTRST